MPTANGSCQFALALWQEVETRRYGMDLCGVKGPYREQRETGITYGYYLCDEHVDMVGVYG